MANILIAGCGYVGNRLASLLLEQHHQVWAISRSPIENLPAEVTWIPADLTKPLSTGLIGEPLDYVFYTASASGTRDEAVYQAIYVDGPARMLEWLQQGHPQLKRFLFTSSTSVYAQNDASWVDEKSSTEPLGFSGVKMLEGEAVVQRAFCSSVVVRFSGIYGPDRMTWTKSAPKSERFTNHIHQEDCAGVLIHLMGLNEVPPVVLATDCEPYIRKGIISSTPSKRNAGNKRCSNRRLLETGYAFAYPTYREGYAHEDR